jgi:hypothetical protein
VADFPDVLRELATLASEAAIRPWSSDPAYGRAQQEILGRERAADLQAIARRLSPSEWRELVQRLELRAWDPDQLMRRPQAEGGARDTWRGEW